MRWPNARPGRHRRLAGVGSDQVAVEKLRHRAEVSLIELTSDSAAVQTYRADRAARVAIESTDDELDTRGAALPKELATPVDRNRGIVMRTEKDKMLAGELYDASAPEIQADLAANHRWLARCNDALDIAPYERRKLLVERFAAVA
jgi:Maltose acetyltransferase hexapeptide capping motif